MHGHLSDIFISNKKQMTPRRAAALHPHLKETGFQRRKNTQQARRSIKKTLKTATASGCSALDQAALLSTITGIYRGATNQLVVHPTHT